MSYQETQIQNFIVNRLSKAKYEELLQNNEIQDNELYLIKEDEMDANGDPIHNVGTPKLSSDAVNKDYVDKLINSTLNAANKDYVDTLVNSVSAETLTQTKGYTDTVCSSLSDTVDALFDTFTADNTKIHNELSDNIDNKIFLSDEENGERYTDLSIIKISEDDYNALVCINQLDNDILYVIESENINAYEKPINNVGTPELSSDATNKDYVDNLVNSTSEETLNQAKTYTNTVSAETLNQAKIYTNTISNSLSTTVDNLVNSISVETLKQANDYSDELCVSLSTTVDAFINDSTNIHNELQSNIDNKIYISDTENGERYTDLSIIKIPEEEYNLLVYNKQVDHNTLYVVKSENLNAYGNVISNVIMTDDLFESEAATKHYVDTHLAEIEQKFLTADNDNKAPTESPTFSGTVRLTETPENECDDDVIVNAGWVRKNQLNLPSYDSITRTSVGTTLTASQFIAETDGWFAFQITGVRHTNNQIYLDINGQKTFRALPSGGMSNYVQQVNLTTQFLYLHAGTVISCSYTGTFSSNTSLSEFTAIHAT